MLDVGILNLWKSIYITFARVSVVERLSAQDSREVPNSLFGGSRQGLIIEVERDTPTRNVSHLFHLRRIEQFFDFEQDDQSGFEFRESGDIRRPFRLDDFRRWVNLFWSDANHLRHRVDRTANRLRTHVGDNCARFFICLFPFQIKQATKINDRDDRPPQIADAFDVVGHLGHLRHPVGNQDFLNLLDPKCVLLLGKSKPYELHRRFRFCSRDRGRGAGFSLVCHRRGALSKESIEL